MLDAELGPAWGRTPCRRSVGEDDRVLEDVVAVVAGVGMVAYAIWRWRTPGDRGTAAAWRLFGSKYEERPETGLDWADRKVRQSAIPALAGAALAVGGLVRIVSSLV